MAAHAHLKTEFTEDKKAIISWAGSFIFYRCISISMVFLNKYLLSSEDLKVSWNNCFHTQYMHTWLTMYYNNIRLLLYDSVTVTLWCCHGFCTKCIGYYMNCIGAVTQSYPMGTNTTHHIVTFTQCHFVEKPWLNGRVCNQAVAYHNT